MKKIVLFASGSGSNVENIVTYFKTRPHISVSLVLTNRSDAPVLERCKRLGVPAIFFNRKAFFNSDVIITTLQSLDPQLIVLAGFLWKIPKSWVEIFPNKIINVHPALLPKYGGKGMYGNHVHVAVKENGETETGITIHYVNEHYDEGSIIAQHKVAITTLDTPKQIAEKVHRLEYEHFPRTIEILLDNNG